jgi:predicted negative regulator of RcsB-dependent stress response
MREVIVEAYRSEEEQLEAIKQWLRKNGSSMVTGILLAALLVVGGYSWKQRQQQRQDAASIQYQELLAAVGGLEKAPSKEMLATAHHLADTLKTDFSGTAYAQLAALFNARLAVQDNDLAKAESELRWVLERKPKAELAELTQLRLARVLHAKGDDNGALALLDKAKPGSYASAYAQLRGDISLARGDSGAARAAYEQARALEGKLHQPVHDPVLEIKLRDLAPGGAGAADHTSPAKGES